MPEKNDAAAGGQEFVLTRTFPAPRELMFRLWTEPAHLQQWMSPKGFTVLVANMDLRPGGVYHYGMRGPDGSEMWGKWLIREVVPPERLVWLNGFSDAAGGLTRHPMAPDWPQWMLSVITFTEDQGRTTVTLRWSPFEASEAERQVFAAAHAGMTQGWGGTMEQLEAYLALARS